MNNKIEQLKAENEQLKNRVAELEKEAERLKSLIGMPVDYEDEPHWDEDDKPLYPTEGFRSVKIYVTKTIVDTPE